MVETDQFDLTYFLHFQFQSVKRTLEEAHDYLSRKRSEHRDFLRRVKRLGDFNYRQQALLIRALHRTGSRFTVKSHSNSHGVAPQTARTDLIALEDVGLLQSWVDGKTRHWEPQNDLKERLRERLPRRKRRRRRP